MPNVFNSVEPFEQTFNIPSTEGSMWNLVKIGQVVLEMKMLKDYMILKMYIVKGARSAAFDCGTPWTFLLAFS